jgi:hypothetical protein
MAVIKPIYKLLAPAARQIRWEGLAADGDTGKSAELPRYPDKTVHFYGNFGGGTVKFQGSNDPRANPEDPDHANAAWFDMEDVNGDLIINVAEGAKTISQAPHYIRPILEGATGADLNVSLVARKN